MPLLNHRAKSSSPRKIAVLTGATGGVAKALIPYLLEKDYKVALLGRNEKKLQATQALFGHQTYYFPLDFSTQSEIKNVVQSIVEQLGPPSLLINNAGTITPGNIFDLPNPSITQQLDINLTSPIAFTKTFLPHMMPQGHIIFINSIGGIMPLKGSATYSAAKFGLRGFALALAMELKTKNIKVSSIFPGAIDTEMLEKEALEGGTPLNFLAAPLGADTVAQAVLKALREGKLEYYLPYSDGIGARLALSLPFIVPPLMPFLEFFGKKGMKKYLDRLKKGA